MFVFLKLMKKGIKMPENQITHFHSPIPPGHVQLFADLWFHLTQEIRINAPPGAARDILQ